MEETSEPADSSSAPIRGAGDCVRPSFCARGEDIDGRAVAAPISIGAAAGVAAAFDCSEL